MRLRSPIRFIPGVLMMVGAAHATPPLFPHHQQDYAVDSGIHDGETNRKQGARHAFRHIVHVPGAPWLRLRVGRYNLGTQSHVTFRSLEDGGLQRLDARTLPDWQNTSAYFNGDAVEMELVVAPGDQGVFITLDRLVVGERVDHAAVQSEGGIETLCGGDNRIASTDPAVGRINGCTAWLISNGAVLTAGHCADFDPDDSGPGLPDGVLDLSGVISFNVPLSDSDGTPNAADPNDQYPINTANVTWRFDGEGQGLGKDWAVFGVLANSNTGLRPHIAQGFKRMTREGPAIGATIRVTGYGVDNGTANRTEQTHTGPYVGEFSSSADIWHRYQVDTQGANSGSPIIWEANQFAIGIHTNGGCNDDGSGSNSGTSFEVNALETAIRNFPGANTVYVDSVSGHPAPSRDGTVFRPYATVALGVTNVVSGGRISVVAGSYTAAAGNTFIAGEDGKSFFIEAPVGTVTIGN